MRRTRSPKDAWNALLKSIEEPPDFVIFMFASTEPSLFPPAILSRLQRYDVRRLTVAEIEGKLTRILTADGREADPAAIHLIARLAAGGMRDAESMLDQLLSAAPERIDESHVRDLLGLADAEVVESFIDHLVRGDGAAGVALLDSLEERGRDIRALLDQAVEAIRAELIAGLSDPASARHDPSALAAAGRRLAAIDPNRAGIGGLRFQLELAMFAGSPASGSVTPVVACAGGARPDSPGRDRAPSQRSRRRRRDGRAYGPASPGRHADRRTCHRRQAPDLRRQRPTPTRRAPDTDPPATTEEAPPPAVEATAPAASPAAIPIASPAAAPASPPAGGTREAALAEVLAAWPAIVELLSAHPPTKPLIVSCRPVAVDGAIVTLGFPEEQAFLKDQAERRKPGIEAGIAAVIGHPVTVHCVVANVELPPAASDDLVAEARRIFAEELADVGEVS